MRNPLKPLTLSIGFACLLFTACNDVSSKDKDDASVSEKQTPVQRGEYLVNTMGCDDCHSPKSMGPKGPTVIADLRLSGYPQDRPIVKPDPATLKQGFLVFGPDLCQAAGPWGISFSANLTADSTGIGTWSEDQFIKAIREGKSKGLDNTRPLLPPMPWPNFAKLTDDDLKAVFAFLKSTKPVRNLVPAPVHM